jgi:hemoglobin/transferrin/lactoferrin receptor protein
MSKKSLTLSLILPCYLFGDVYLGAISVNETAIQETSSIEIDLIANEQHQSNSLFDLFKNDSSLELAGGGASNAKRIYVKGAEGSALNITLDGAAQGKNIFQHRGNELGINPDILKVVDIRTAPDATKAGALGGSIEMTTKDAQDFVKNGKNAGAILQFGHNTNAQANTGSLTAYGVYDKHYGVVASVSGVNSENYEDGHNQEMYATAYEDRNYLLKFTLDNLDNHDLKISFNQNTNSGDMQWAKNGSDKGPTPENALLEKIVSTTTSYTLQHNYSGGKLLNLDTNINFTNVLVDREDENKQYENDNVGIKLQNHFYLDTQSLKNKISLGIQVVDEETTGVYECSTADCAINKYAPTSSLNKALFIQSKTTLSNLDINYGLRFDDYELETGFGEATDSTYSPNFGLEYRLGEKSNIYANYGQSSRMSGTIPFTWMTNVKKDTTYSSDLKAEKSTRYELGYNVGFDNLITNDDTFIFDANVFRTEFTDVIAGEDTTGKFGAGGRTLVDIYNIDYTYVSKGFELKASYYLDNYFGTLSYTQIDTNTFNEQTAGTSSEPIAVRRIAGWDNKKLVFNTGIDVTSGLSIDYTLTAVAGIDNADQVTRSGYVTHDISTKYQASKNEPWTFYLAVNNFTDTYYAPNTTLADSSGNFRRDMGRDFRLNVKYEF